MSPADRPDAAEAAETSDAPDTPDTAADGGNTAPDAPRPDGGTAPVASRPDGEVATDAVGGHSSAPTVANAVSAPAGPQRGGRDMFGASAGSDTTGYGGLIAQPKIAVSTPRPYGGWFDECVDALQQAYPRFSEDILRVVVDRGELTLYVEPARVADVLAVLRDSPDHRFELLSSLSGVDYPTETRRLHAVYHLTSLTYRRRLRVEAAVSVADPHVASATGVYPTADFHERECWDFFGIVFDGHPALTRIMMPDDWEGHPQRKDYPLGGIPVEYKGATIPPPDERRTYA